MKTSLAQTSLGLLSLLAVSAMFTGCAVSPDYSHYDWSARGGMVEEQDRALASARIEPFQSRRAPLRIAADEPLTPTGAPPADANAVVIDPRAPSGPIVERRTTTVVAR